MRTTTGLPGGQVHVVRTLCVAGIALTLSLAPRARADGGEAVAPPASAPERNPGGHVYVGLGASAIGALSPGVALSYELSIEVRRFLFNAELLGGGRVNGYDTLFLGGSLGTTLSDANEAPYLLGGVGYIAYGNIALDSVPSRGSQRDQVVLTLEVGYVLGRSRRFGQIWLGLRGLVPVATIYTRYDGPMPDFPFALLTARFLL
jgi:hypothetical protein